MTDRIRIARVSGYANADEYNLNWDNYTASLKGTVPTEAHSFSVPTIAAERHGATLVLLGTPPLRDSVFQIVSPVDQRKALASGWVQRSSPLRDKDDHPF